MDAGRVHQVGVDVGQMDGGCHFVLLVVACKTKKIESSINLDRDLSGIIEIFLSVIRQAFFTDFAASRITEFQEPRV